MVSSKIGLIAGRQKKLKGLKLLYTGVRTTSYYSKERENVTLYDRKLRKTESEKQRDRLGRAHNYRRHIYRTGKSG